MKEHFCPAEKSIITYQDKCNWCGEKEWVWLTDSQIEQVYFEVVKEHRGAPMPWGQVQFGRALLDKFTMYLKTNQTAITSLRQAIAELESQEPFCYAYKENGEDFFAPKDGYYPVDAIPLYTHPPQRTEVNNK
jgi:hypothetical protein